MNLISFTGRATCNLVDEAYDIEKYVQMRSKRKDRTSTSLMKSFRKTCLRVTGQTNMMVLSVQSKS